MAGRVAAVTLRLGAGKKGYAAVTGDDADSVDPLRVTLSNVQFTWRKKKKVKICLYEY